MAEKPEKFIRPPVVVVMGHVDHGKTTLLDYIRKTNVALKETGGITQHIGAYEITFGGKRLTFLDTPGHEAFSKMRSRGAKVADVAILVVAADEGVKPQTKEAINHIFEAKIPMVVAINKMDKPTADPQKVKQELAALNVLVEDWGGNVPVAEISAKTGQGVDTLLELLLLVAEMEELKADPNAPAEGVVIESQLDRRRGPIATLLVQNGTLKKGDAVLAGDAFAKIKLLENFEGSAIGEAPPSSPVRVLGWEKLPQVGEHFRAGSEEELRSFVKEITELRSKSAAQPGDILLIVKADVAGSEEALLEALKKIAPEDIKISILSSGVGDVSESDVKLAYASGAIILAFRVRILPEAASFLKHQPVRIITSDIIYELLELVEKEIARVREEKNLAAMRTRLEVLALFGLKGNRQIIGGKVIEGVLKKRMLMAVIRRGEKIGKAKIINLQKEKRDVEEVETGAECGLLVETALKILKGDILEEIKDEKN
jgi:translation initiation factor IF-2